MDGNHECLHESKVPEKTKQQISVGIVIQAPNMSVTVVWIFPLDQRSEWNKQFSSKANVMRKIIFTLNFQDSSLFLSVMSSVLSACAHNSGSDLLSMIRVSLGSLEDIIS